MVEYLNTSEIHFNHDVADRNSLDEASEEGSDDSTEEYSPYSVEDLAAILTDFYKFLANLHYDPADLKLPPPERWNLDILPKAIVENKSEDVVELMRRVPYFKENEKSTHVHYKSKLVDYTNGEQHGIAENEDELVKDLCEVWCSKGGIVDHQRLLVIAGGYESGGRTLILDVLHGEITEEIIRHITCPAVDIKEFFEKVEEEYRSLQLIPCPGRETQEAHRVPERAEEISEEEVKAQTGEWFGFTDLDWQFVRQVYRRCGWPDAFRRQQAVELIGDFMASNKDRTHEWEPAFR
ncbi:hypothetical protein CB0940_11592 [Cercospora beticola]|uniref:Uncharacterized protein n=1 Tax=Cercospora beticola TaxID=122368 RepID=A0A2G5HE93_CERBT|nr:hypothetical protein CB0940_11592 [Cercospora beticola]PIA90857.1 hypothetical protein CB0940_11592 [Cercospora beticola]WPB08465.1 hypothetical protein RHO25_013131 [Cercospora beticola]CAK1367619.1 unnamed protein product [Cercospora beticola]